MAENKYDPNIDFNRFEENKKEFIDRNNKLEALLFKLRRSRWLHRRASKYYHPRNIIMVAVSFIISSSISILSISNTNSSANNTSNTYIGYIITITGFLNGFFTLLTNQLDYKTKTNNNSLAAKAYDSLITKVSFEINFPSEIECNEFVGLIEENILKIKNELEVSTEERFEKELIKIIHNDGDISSEAGYGIKEKNNESILDKIKRLLINNHTDLGTNGVINNDEILEQLQKSQQQKNIKNNSTIIEMYNSDNNNNNNNNDKELNTQFQNHDKDNREIIKKIQTIENQERIIFDLKNRLDIETDDNNFLKKHIELKEKEILRLHEVIYEYNTNINKRTISKNSLISDQEIEETYEDEDENDNDNKSIILYKKNNEQTSENHLLNDSDSERKSIILYKQDNEQLSLDNNNNNNNNENKLSMVLYQPSENEIQKSPHVKKRILPRTPSKKNNEKKNEIKNEIKPHPTDEHILNHKKLLQEIKEKDLMRMEKKMLSKESKLLTLEQQIAINSILLKKQEEALKSQTHAQASQAFSRSEQSPYYQARSFERTSSSENPSSPSQSSSRQKSLPLSIYSMRKI